MLAPRGDSLSGKTCLISGSGNVAQYTVEALLNLGAKAVTLSDSDGFIYDPAGIDREKLAFVLDLKNVRRGRIREYADHFPGVTFVPDGVGDHNPLWKVPADCAFPSATQNEINGKDAANLISNGIIAVTEGSNMPTTSDGVELFLAAGILYGPSKAANAGGVAVSGLEMSQDSQRRQWERQDVDQRAAGDHAGHPRADHLGGRGVRLPGQQRGRREHRRIHQGGGRDAGRGSRVA